MIRVAASHVPVGIAVQDGDYQRVNPRTSKEVTIGEIVQFGKEYLNLITSSGVLKSRFIPSG